MDIINRLPISSDASSQAIIQFKKHIIQFTNKSHTLKISESTHDLSWMSTSWYRQASILSETKQEQFIYVRTVEIAWFTTLKRRLKSYHCFVDGGFLYGNPNYYLVDWKRYEELLPSIIETTELPSNGEEFVKQSKHELKSKSQQIDEVFSNIDGVYFKDEELVLKKSHKPYLSHTLPALQAAIHEKMPKTSIIDVLSDTDRWLKLETVFKPLSGHEAKIDEMILRIVLSRFCFGCNVGARQTANSVRNLNENSIFIMVYIKKKNMLLYYIFDSFKCNTYANYTIGILIHNRN